LIQDSREHLSGCCSRNWPSSPFNNRPIMASTTTYIPRFLLPQYGPMWPTAVRSAALSRPLNAEAGQVIVRYASQALSRRPSAVKSAVTKAPTRRSSHTKSGESKAAKASAPTKPPAKTVVAKTTSASKSAGPAPARHEPAVEAVAPKPAAAAAAARPPPSDPSKPIVLEKPERFNPPSHGARLPRSTPRHYGGPLTADEVVAQTRKSYPGLPPPPNTWSHWFINSRGVHTFITLVRFVSPLIPAVPLPLFLISNK
jgi:hypothetical protein